jgi:hypothetical protein
VHAQHSARALSCSGARATHLWDTTLPPPTEEDRPRKLHALTPSVRCVGKVRRSQGDGGKGDKRIMEPMECQGENTQGGGESDFPTEDKEARGF